MSRSPGWCRSDHPRRGDRGRIVRRVATTRLPRRRVGFFRGTVEERVQPCCPFSHRTRPPEMRIPLNAPLRLSPHKRSLPDFLLYIAAMDRTETQVAEINLQPSQARDYSAYVPVQLGKLTTAAFIDSGNTFANVISPQTMTALGITVSQLEPVPQLSVGTAAVGKRMKILGQATDGLTSNSRQHPAKFRIRPWCYKDWFTPWTFVGHSYNGPASIRSILEASSGYAEKTSRCAPSTPGGRSPSPGV